MDELYIGLMSGTSADSIDAVIVTIHKQQLELLNSYSQPIPDALKHAIYAMNRVTDNEIEKVLQLDQQLGILFSEAVLNLLHKAKLSATQIVAIGSHGQTLRHYPNIQTATTLQVGDANIIVQHTGITTVADFRRADMAVGGQGAPLVPAFHAQQFTDKNSNRIILNIGGIANITYLPSSENPILGFDTGPGNCLMDEWIQRHQQLPYDENGQWAATGYIHPQLLNVLLQHKYFTQAIPKSSGRDIFNIDWLDEQLIPFKNIPAVDVQTTLCAFTTASIELGIKLCGNVDEIIVCGGGGKNNHLIERLRSLSAHRILRFTNDFGIPIEWVEASAFAWLAYRTLHQQTGNLPSVTGAKSACILGAVYYATRTARQ